MYKYICRVHDSDNEIIWVLTKNKAKYSSDGNFHLEWKDEKKRSLQNSKHHIKDVLLLRPRHHFFPPCLTSMSEALAGHLTTVLKNPLWIYTIHMYDVFWFHNGAFCQKTTGLQVCFPEVLVLSDGGCSCTDRAWPSIFESFLSYALNVWFYLLQPVHSGVGSLPVLFFIYGGIHPVPS